MADEKHASVVPLLDKILLTRNSIPEVHAVSHAENPSENSPLLCIRVTNLAGNLLAEIHMNSAAHIADVKAEIAASEVGVPAIEQRIACGNDVCDDDVRVSSISRMDDGLKPVINLTLIRAPRPGFAASASYDGTCRVWDLASSDVVRISKVHRGPVRCIEADWLGRRILTGSKDKRLILWSLDTCESQEIVHVMKGHKGSILCCAASWAAPTARPAKASSAAAPAITSFIESRQMTGHHMPQSSSRAVSGDDTGEFRFWDLDRGVCLFVMNEHAGAIWCTSMDSNQRRAITGSADGNICLWDLQNGTCLTRARCNSEPVRSLSIDWSSGQGLTASRDGSILHWNMESLSLGAPRNKRLQGNPSSSYCLALHWSSREALSGDTDGVLRLWNLSGCDVLDGGIVHDALAERDATVGPVDLLLVRALRGHDGPVWSVKVDWSFKRVLSGSEDRTLMLWDIGSGSCLFVLRAHAGAVIGVVTDWPCDTHG